MNEFYDMQISMDPSVDNAVKTSAPGRIVEFVVNITNAGNVPDTPSLHNHTSSKDGSTGNVIWNTLPGHGLSIRLERRLEDGQLCRKRFGRRDRVCSDNFYS